jgi:hypothetical protein
MDEKEKSRVLRRLGHYMSKSEQLHEMTCSLPAGAVVGLPARSVHDMSIALMDTIRLIVEVGIFTIEEIAEAAEASDAMDEMVKRIIWMLISDPHVETKIVKFRQKLDANRQEEFDEIVDNARTMATNFREAAEAAGVELDPEQFRPEEDANQHFH